MKLKSPLMSLEAHGTLGGLEIRRGPYGSVCGRQSISTRLATPLQLQTRANLITAHRAWESLSDSDRHSWDQHATGVLTGRNTFVSMFLRFSTAGIAPIISPKRSAPVDPLRDLQLSYLIWWPDNFTITWTTLPAAQNLILFYTQSSFSRRQLPTLSKMKYQLTAYTSNEIINWITPYPAAIYHFRLDLVSRENGDLLGRHLLRLPNPWP